MAVERARRIQPIRRGKQKVEKKGLVVGGGLSGMTASLRLAEQGYEVFLIEKEKELGGNLRESFYTLKGSDPQALLQDIDPSRLAEMERSTSSPRPSVTGFERKNGHYRTKILHQGEEKVLDHGTLILATGGKEMTPQGLSLRKRSTGDHPAAIGEDDSSEG